MPALHFDRILAAEHRAINRRRQRLGRAPLAVPDEGKAAGYARADMFETAGLALSGGGIRSAAFSLGAMQALAQHGVLDRIDYLSTVSGGGYAGTAVTVAMSEGAGDFPFVAGDDKSDTAAMKNLRYGANYLRSGSYWQMLLNVAVYLRGLAANLLLVGPVLLFFAAITLVANPTFLSLSEAGVFGFDPINRLLLDRGAFGVTITLGLIVLLAFFLWACVRRFFDGHSEMAGWWPRLGAGLLILLALSAFFELQPVVVRQLITFSRPSAGEVEAQSVYIGIVSWLMTFVPPAIAVIGFLSRTIGDILKSGAAGAGWKGYAARALSRMFVALAALSLPLMLWLAYLVLVYWGVKPASFVSASQGPDWLQQAVMAFVGEGWSQPYAVAYLAVGICGAISWFLLGPNSNSLHRLYRDRLSATFAAFMRGGEIVSADTLKLSALDPALAPFPIINAALNIHGSEAVNRHGRNADFFMFTPLHCGSQSTGYVVTGEVEKLDAALDVASAMAISGAAISSNMGTASMRSWRFTLALLNLRLGYWMRNPVRPEGGAFALPSRFYLLNEMIGNLDEKSRYIYLTDGGHIDNLGLYELLRRRCRLIVVIDGEADRDLRLPSFVQQQRFARIDLGIRIDLAWSKIGSGEARGAHGAIGVVEYPGGSRGTLLYVKSSLTGDENDYIADYARRHPAFPHETTGDQFFSEEQFEAYRALGFHCVHGLLGGKHPAQTGRDTLASVNAGSAAGTPAFDLRQALGLSAAPPRAARGGRGRSR